MNRTRLFKILKWTGIGLAALILCVGGWIWAMWLGSGGEFGGRTVDLVPAGATLVAVVDRPGVNRRSLEGQIDQLFVDRAGFRAVERSPLWAQFFNGQPKTMMQLRDQVVNQLQQVERTVAEIPVLGLKLDDDFLLREAVIGLYPAKEPEGAARWIALTRVSRSVDFGFSFSGFATGDYGNTTVEEFEGRIRVRTRGASPIDIAMFDDVLIAGSDPELVKQAEKLHGGSGKSFSSHPQFEAAIAQLESTSGGKRPAVQLLADLDALREAQGPDPNDPERRAPIDQHFSVSPQVLRLSPEILPSVNAILKQAVDTRAFSMAAWSVDLDATDRARIDQFLVVDPARLDREYGYLKPAWSTAEGSPGFLSILPEDTWAVVTARQPFAELRDSIRPGKHPDGTPKQDAVAGFLDALGPNPPAQSMGIALFGRSLSPDPARDAARKPPSVVSPVLLPGYALFLNWPGVTMDEASSLMQRQLTSMGVTKLRARLQVSGAGDQYIGFDLLEDNSLLRWLEDFACFTVNDHLVFCYSPGRVAVTAMMDAAAGRARSLQTSTYAPWGLAELEGVSHSALVWFAPRGLAQWSAAVGLPTALAEAKFPANLPNGKELREIRMELADEMSKRLGRKVDWTHDEVGRELELVQREWVAKRAPWQREFEGNLSASSAFDDFTALTRTSVERMHTRFVLRLK